VFERATLRGGRKGSRNVTTFAPQAALTVNRRMRLKTVLGMVRALPACELAVAGGGRVGIGAGPEVASGGRNRGGSPPSIVGLGGESPRWLEQSLRELGVAAGASMCAGLLSAEDA
jgi:hypothetical protein